MNRELSDGFAIFPYKSDKHLFPGILSSEWKRLDPIACLLDPGNLDLGVFSEALNTGNFW